MEKYKGIFDMGDCRNLSDFVQKSLKCSEKEAHLFISKFHFFERVENGAELLSFVLENLPDEDLKWKKIDIDKVDLDFLTYLNDLEEESVWEGLDTDYLCNSIVKVLEKATATELGLI